MLIPLVDYLKLIKGLEDSRYRLVNSRISNGMVELTDLQLLEINDLRSGVKKPVTVDYDTIDYGEVDRYCFPPCVMHIIGRAREGINLDHHERVFLVSFLYKIGTHTDNIHELFTRQPDYDRYITDQQIGHIMRNNYTPHACAKLKSYKYCFAEDDQACRYVKHPLNCYLKKKRAAAINRRKKPASTNIGMQYGLSMA